MTSFPLKHLDYRLETHSRYFQWSTGDYATLSCSHDFKHPLKQQVCDMAYASFREAASLSLQQSSPTSCDEAYTLGGAPPNWSALSFSPSLSLEV